MGLERAALYVSAPLTAISGGAYWWFKRDAARLAHEAEIAGESYRAAEDKLPLAENHPEYFFEKEGAAGTITKHAEDSFLESYTKGIFSHDAAGRADAFFWVTVIFASLTALAAVSVLRAERRGED